MGDWQESFVRRLGDAQARYQSAFEDAMKKHVQPAFEEMRPFMTANSFRLSMPLQERGRRSFKFELAENAYALLVFRSQGIGECEVRTEIFAVGHEPLLDRSIAHVSDIAQPWSTKQFQQALDELVDLLAGRPPRHAGRPSAAEEELVVV